MANKEYSIDVWSIDDNDGCGWYGRFLSVRAGEGGECDAPDIHGGYFYEDLCW